MSKYLKINHEKFSKLHENTVSFVSIWYNGTTDFTYLGEMITIKHGGQTIKLIKSTIEIDSDILLFSKEITSEEYEQKKIEYDKLIEYATDTTEYSSQFIGGIYADMCVVHKIPKLIYDTYMNNLKQ